MPRRKLSEYRAKRIVTDALGISYEGWTDAGELPSDGRHVVKVDQAVKKRFKNGLVGLDLDATGVRQWIEQIKQRGYTSFIIEPYREHDQNDERYISIIRDARGVHLTFSQQGGVDIEENSETLETIDVDDRIDWQYVSDKTALSPEQIQTLIDVFSRNYCTLMEINPYIVVDGSLMLLDVAVEVDDAATLLVDNWSENDLRNPPREQSEEEKVVTALSESSPASFAFQMINPDGALFVLLSGGGASVTVCDEVYSAGYGKQLANYGEYSGNPTTEEAYIYTSAVLGSLLRSKAPKKALFIGGAVANFTDIAKTFAGVTKALDEYGDRLREQNVRVVVRRGGPNQKVGLKNMQDALDKYELTAAVYDPSTTLDAAVARVIEEIKQ